MSDADVRWRVFRLAVDMARSGLILRRVRLDGAHFDALARAIGAPPGQRHLSFYGPRDMYTVERR